MSPFQKLWGSRRAECILSDHERLFLILFILGFYLIVLELFACILVQLRLTIILSACYLASDIFQRLISTKVIDFQPCCQEI